MNIYYSSLKERLPENVWKKYVKELPDIYSTRADRFYRWQDRQLYLFGKLLIRNGFREYNLPDSTFFNILINDYGKPYIDYPLKFNLSHSGSFVVCVFSQAGEVGIDIEEIKPIDIVALENIFTHREREILDNSANKESDFYKFWARKESIIKGIGQGLSLPLGKIDVSDGQSALYNNHTWHITDITIDSNYACCVASDHPTGFSLSKIEWF